MDRNNMRSSYVNSGPRSLPHMSGSKRHNGNGHSGNHTSNHGGSHSGSHSGNNSGNHSGNHSGSHTGNHSGSHTGNHGGSHSGSHTGNHGGSHSGNHSNSHSGNHNGSHSGHHSGNGHNGARLSPPAQSMTTNSHSHSNQTTQHDDLINYIYDSWNKVTRELERGSEEAKYYQEVRGPRHLAAFRAFDLEEWWARRLLQTINRNKHRS